MLRKFTDLPVGRLVLLVPVEVQNPVEEVLVVREHQACLLCLLLQTLILEDWLLLGERPKTHLSAVLNDRVGLSSEVEVSIGWVVDPDLLALNKNLAVNSLLNKGGPRADPHVNPAPAHILHIDALDSKRHHDSAIHQLLHNQVLLAFIFGLRPRDMLANQPANIQVVTLNNQRWFRLLYFCGLAYFLLLWLSGKGKFLLWDRFFLFSLDQLLELL